ncbi:MAG: arginine--tRNA ligase, partial [Duncaniella sp.]|nr:arginine--tRNA ligase [Duncaniella sp.]
LVHFSYGMVELPEGKMKSREGTVVDADDLMDDMVATAKTVSAELGKLDGLTDAEMDDIAETVGLGALKYFLLKVDPRKNITFNPKESIDFNGNTGPFIQYTYARIRSVLRKAEEEKLPTASYADVIPGEKETALIQALAEFPAVVKNAGRTYSPALIANYVYDLVKTYNQFYHDCSILKEEDAAKRTLRLELSRQTARVVATGMGLLGIRVPERM